MIDVANPTSTCGYRVDADLDYLLIALYVALDDHIIPAYRAAAGRVRRLGRPPAVTDAELVCLAVAPAHGCTRWIRYETRGAGYNQD
jgi:hypothetical protein